MALFTQLLDLPAGMKHRRVVTTTKGIANLRKTVVSQLFRQRHRHLARTGHRAGSTLGKEIRDFDLVVLRHRLLNIVDGDQFSCNASKSRSASRTKSMVIARPVKLALAMTRFSAPSNSRTLDRRRLAIKNATSPGKRMSFSSAFFIRIATRVSSSGGSIATVSPQPKRDFKRSSTPLISFG